MHPPNPRSIGRKPIFASTFLAFVLFGYSGCDLAPSQDLINRHRVVAEADNRIMAFVCPERHRLALESEDPLISVTEFVQRGKALKGWETELIDPYSATPARLVKPLDSLVAAINLLARSFDPAVGTAASHGRACYGNFALNCDKLFLAQDVLYRIDGSILRRAREDYFRHRAVVAKVFADADWPLNNLKTCAEGI